jgi:hypothetical protein
MLPEVLPTGAVVEEQEIKGTLGGLSSHFAMFFSVSRAAP